MGIIGPFNIGNKLSFMNFLTPILAALAFIMSAVALYIQFSSSTTTSNAAIEANYLQEAEQQPLLIIEQQTEQLDTEQLQQVINQLNARLLKLEANQTANLATEQSITEIVDAYVAKREQEELEKLKQRDPFQGFYQSLPDDYEEKLKTDPDYAVTMQQELKQKVLDTSLSEEDRLAAMAQLQMTLGMLAEFGNMENSHELSNAIMDIANNTADEGNRIRALEVLSSGPDINPKLAPNFIDLVRNDSNNYVRNIAANGLGMMMYSQNLDMESREQLANNIIQIMKTTNDVKLQSILQQNFGSEQDIEKSLEYLREEGL